MHRKRKQKNPLFLIIFGIKSDGLCTSLEQTAVLQKDPLRYSLQIHFPAFSTISCLLAFVCLFFFSYLNKDNVIYWNI